MTGAILPINRREALDLLDVVERLALRGRPAQLWYSFAGGYVFPTSLPVYFENFEGAENFKPEEAVLLYEVDAYDLKDTETGQASAVDWSDPYHIFTPEYQEAEAHYLRDSEKVLDDILVDAEHRLGAFFVDVTDGLRVLYRWGDVIIVNPKNLGSLVAGYESGPLYMVTATTEGPAPASDPSYTYSLNFKRGADVKTGIRWNFTPWPPHNRCSFELDGVLYCGPDEDGKYTAFTTENNPPTLYVALLTEQDAAGQVVRSWIVGAVEEADLVEGGARYS